MMMRTRSKKTKAAISNPQTWSKERYKFEEIPLDLVIEIIRRLPVKSVARFILVSKLWATIIRSRDFITSFPFGSSSQPRLLVAIVDLDRRRRRENWHFFSPSSSSFLSRPLPNPERIEYYSHYVNGLMSIGYGQQQIVYNPSTGKSMILPRVKTRRRIVNSYFGYHPINEQYKVLCMTEKMSGDMEPSSQHQVFTLGDNNNRKSWRMIDCRIPHSPWSNGVCIDGVVYYIAEVLFEPSLMRFDLRSENLDLLTSLSVDIPAPALYGYTLINYVGKVAMPTQTTAFTFDVWVLETRGLLKKCFSIEPWKSLLMDSRLLGIKGTTRSGEFIFAPSYYYDEFYVFHYNPDNNSFRNVKIDVNGDYEFKRGSTRAIVFSDYVESVRLL